jgi:hypothetical protein
MRAYLQRMLSDRGPTCRECIAGIRTYLQRMLADGRAYLQRMHCRYEDIFTENAGRHGVLLTEDAGGIASLEMNPFCVDTRVTRG